MPEELSDQMTSLNPEIFTWELIVVAAVVVLTFVWFYTRGKDFIVTSILGAYIAAATMAFAPYIRDIDWDLGLEQYQLKFIIFVVLLIVFTWAMSTNGYFEPYVCPSGWEVAVFGVLFAGLVVTIGAMFAGPEVLKEFSPITRLVFGHEIAATAWLVGPMAILLFIRGET